jgi:hypothetical protein
MVVSVGPFSGQRAVPLVVPGRSHMWRTPGPKSWQSGGPIPGKHPVPLLAERWSHMWKTPGPLPLEKRPVWWSLARGE